MSTNQPKDDASRYPDVLKSHEYDGIQEYDNPMPGWWLWIFYATIAWSVFYVAALGAGWIDGYDAQLERGVNEVAELRAAAEADIVPIDEEALVAAMGDDMRIAAGETAYGRTCAACHAADGSGGIGAALNDGQWIHGDSPLEVYTVIRDGVPAAGMPAHGHFDEEMLIDLTAFILNF